MDQTPKGIKYPTSGDAVAPLESVFSAMASSIDGALPLSGTQSVSFTATAGNTQDVTVTITPALATAPQKVLATVRGPVSGSSSYIATVTNSANNSNSTTIAFRIYRLGGTTGTQSINLVWAVLP